MFFRKSFYKTEWTSLFLTAAFTAIASEIKVIPFSGEDFRFGLGSIAFFLLILILPPVSLIRTGISTGITVICFRIFGDILFNHVPFWISFKSHLPVFLYYFLFALGFSVIKIENFKTYPLLLGAFAAIFEFIGNTAEHLMRYWLLNHANLGLQEWVLLGGVALLRSYFVVGLYSSITVSEQKKQMQEMLGVGSELYVETLYLQKSLDNIEQITVSSHDLYRKLKKKNLSDLSKQALLITQEIHEVKKDSQRILSGLSKISTHKKIGVVLLSDVLGIVVTANEKYSELLGKKITFHFELSTDFETDQQIPLLAILNNLTANAIEAIEETGTIHIEIFDESDYTAFIVKDTGKGISEEDLSFIFEPGYTTKYNDHGVAATGIGLSHVQDIVHSLKGQIKIESSAKGTTFRLQIPANNLKCTFI
ncbi:sensor histidine kinase [Cytobacillus dafuensis]|uniref:histidine kinase n=1 Tax=Cytobacillus dafuensis TaxID=1742359 RepID=A0A5B8Z1C4_CYTDA|nr:sensor histidine kinase [Cytobacillus dafuensis]QED46678.1 sensor histidine kinase [Cytobacillus dafuensis]